ncbi:hypothetical protein WOB59_00830 [Methylocystis sp. IM4]|uniref:hypothetical protein n=1 Tax=Methylocystis sp. IM4 TaxID=3136560 RepID=UPI0031196A57
MLDFQRAKTHNEVTAMWAGLFLALMARELARVEGLLDGMIRAGVGLDAIAAYLGSTRDQVLNELSAQGLVLAPGQADKRFFLRKNGWTAADHALFITGWVCGAPVSALGEILGRSPSALYGKRARLGLAPRKRRSAARRQVMASHVSVGEDSVVRDASPESSADFTQETAPVAAAPATARAPETTPPKKQRCTAEPSKLSPVSQPALYAAVDEFMANRLPAGVDVSINEGTRDHVTTGLALLGGMSREAICEATGFGKNRVNTHVDRSHLDGLRPTNAHFDPALLETALKEIAVECVPGLRRLIFRRPGDHRMCVVAKRNQRRRELNHQRRLEKREAQLRERESQLREREEQARAANVVIVKGVSLPRLRCLERPAIEI